MKPAGVASCRAVFSASLLAKETADGPASWEDVSAPVLGDTKLKIPRRKRARGWPGACGGEGHRENLFLQEEESGGAALSRMGGEGGISASRPCGDLLEDAPPAEHRGRKDQNKTAARDRCVCSLTWGNTS